MNVSDTRMTLKEKKKTEEALIPVLSFLLCAFGAWGIICITKRMGGYDAVVRSDLLEQYLPAVSAYVRQCLHRSTAYSWDLCSGMKSSFFYDYYVGGSLIHLLFFLQHFIGIAQITVLVILIKTGLAGAFFVLFLRRVHGIKPEIALLFSICYALSSFQIFYNFVNIIWMDAYYILPLLLCFITDFVRTGRWKKLVLLYAYLFLCNFYMAYIVGIISAIYLAGDLLFRKEEWRGGNDVKRTKEMLLHKLFRFAGIVLLSVGLSVFALVPAVQYIFGNMAPDSNSAYRLTFAFGDLCRQFFAGASKLDYEAVPLVYCGLIVLCLLPLFFIRRGIGKREKCFYGMLLLLLCLSCVIPVLYLFWHGFDVPDGWTYRFAFVIVFVCCVMAAMAMQALPEEGITGVALSWGGILLLLLILHLRKPDGADAANVGFLILWGILLFGRVRCRGRGILCAALVLVWVECVYNGVCILETAEKTDPALYETYLECGSAISAEVRAEAGLYRIEWADEPHYNSDSLFGYYGIGDFWTIENYAYRQALSRMGLYTSPKLVMSQGLTPFTRMLLGIRYTFRYDCDEEGKLLPERMEKEAVPYYLGMGFVTDGRIDAFSFSGVNIFENCNELAALLMGEPIEIFSPIAEDEIFYQISGMQEGIVEYRTEEGSIYRHFYQADTADEGPYYIRYLFADHGSPVYGVFLPTEAGIDFGAPVFGGLSGREQNPEYRFYEYKRLSVAFAAEARPVGDQRQIEIVMSPALTDAYYEFADRRFYICDEAAMERLYQKLKQGSLSISEYGDGYVKASVHADGQEPILYTAIPYDRNWKVTAKKGNENAPAQKLETVALLDGAFLGIRFPEQGDYQLTLVYQDPLQPVSTVFSVCCAGLFLILCFLDRKKVRRQSEEQI